MTDVRGKDKDLLESGNPRLLRKLVKNVTEYSLYDRGTSIRKKESDFMLQHHAVNTFSSSDSWVILSDIEQSIKRKIEAVGTPLKDWDIQINYGIKTGFNDAFIIKTEVRDQILANCQSEDERKRTAELIRPNS